MGILFLGSVNASGVGAALGRIPGPGLFAAGGWGRAALPLFALPSLIGWPVTRPRVPGPKRYDTRIKMHTHVQIKTTITAVTICNSNGLTIKRRRGTRGYKTGRTQVT